MKQKPYSWEKGFKTPNRTFYQEYGKVFRIKPLAFLKGAFKFDLIVPLTFWIPTIIGMLLFTMTLGNEIMIERKER